MAGAIGLTGGQLFSVGTSLAGSVMTAVGQQQQADAQLAAQQAQIDANARNSYNQTAALRANQAIDREKQAQEAYQGQMQGEKEKGTAIAAAANSGVTGVSQDEVMAQFDQAISDFKASKTRQKALTDYSYNTNASNVVETAKANQTGMARPISNSSFNTLLGGFADTYANWDTYKYRNTQLK